MKLVFKRHCSSLTSLNLQSTKNPSPKQSQILRLCKLGLLSDAIRVLNSIDSGEITLKPILYASLLQTCTKAVSFNHGLQIHAHVVKSGLETDRFVGNSLLSLYFKLVPNMSETRRVFDGLFVKDVISWTSIITGYVRAGKPGNSIEVFYDMLKFGIEPNAFTLSAVVKACSEIGNLRLGLCFHGVVIGRCAPAVDELTEPGAICWTSVISAFTRSDLFEEALGFFYLMHRYHGLSPDGFTFGTVLTACGNLGRLRQGREMHAKVITHGLRGNVVVESSLVDMYGKCGSVEYAQRVFDRIPKKNSVSCSALLGVYCQTGDFESVIKHFREMEEADLYSFGTVLRACAGLAAVQQGKEVHCQYVRRCGWRDVIVESALVNLYAKCGCIDFARRVFTQMPVRNLITWNSMICGFAQNGGVLLGASTTCSNSTTAERIAKKMIELQPDYHLSYVLLANVYRSVGRWDDALEIGRIMQDRGVKKTPGKSWIESNNKLGSFLPVGDVEIPRRINFPVVMDIV
ncbi:pentatricopeptide repeat-containing protein [Prunus yedoensis var. nudiflora]|uniref:Pentatricopeptide repeat-containing protein n=1 Tax=Prunus yedoensis var. nudiflora TaxID=2094558 RepID=A0A314UNP2_PRUYE|nr:pentatricopeptide repeat-containing protein [Prunus yedoensis var. nudiflora]